VVFVRNELTSACQWNPQTIRQDAREASPLAQKVITVQAILTRWRYNFPFQFYFDLRFSNCALPNLRCEIRFLSAKCGPFLPPAQYGLAEAPIAVHRHHVRLGLHILLGCLGEMLGYSRCGRRVNKFESAASPDPAPSSRPRLYPPRHPSPSLNCMLTQADHLTSQARHLKPISAGSCRGGTMARFRLARWFLFTAALAWVTWFVFTGEPTVEEMLAGAACALFTALFCIRTWREMDLLIQLRAADLLQGLRVPWTLIQGAAQVIAVLAKDLTAGPRADSVLCAVPFERRHDGHGRLRRVLAVSYTSISPNTIVIGIDRSRSLFLYHAISPARLPQMAQNLGVRT
jgi:multisubunit Na+/H+ antiporter MnhE subunit